jgi:hypothetical protein
MLAGSSLNMFSEMISSYLGHWHATELRTLNCIKRGFDLVVGTQWTSVIATGVARRLKIPVALLQGAPLTPTRAWPCIYMGQGQGLFGYTNSLSFDMASKLWWRLKGSTYVTWQVAPRSRCALSTCSDISALGQESRCAGSRRPQPRAALRSRPQHTRHRHRPSCSPPPSCRLGAMGPRVRPRRPSRPLQLAAKRRSGRIYHAWPAASIHFIRKLHKCRCRGSHGVGNRCRSVCWPARHYRHELRRRFCFTSTHAASTCPAPAVFSLSSHSLCDRAKNSGACARRS